ncbi:MAG: MurR/RpiR family transcriptional regulator [Clostridiales bacterium]|nr:MurR/RpiR family transcriptional regulator [Clostridiales bacterium]
MNKKTLPVTDNDSVEYIGRIRAQYDSLSRTQKRIAHYILTHQEEVSHYSVTQLASKTGTVPSTITRFCQALSYKGFSELKVYIEKGLLSPAAINDAIQKNDSLQTVIQKLMNASNDAINDTQRIMDPKVISNVATAILNADTVNIYGHSGGYISALYAQQMLLRAGIHSHAVNDPLDMRISSSILKPKDVVIGIAYSGEARSVVNALERAKANGGVTVVITATPNSTMEKLADYTLYYSHNIPDDLQYLHIGSMCEIAILGAIQAELIHRPEREALISACKDAVLDSRRK